MQNNAVRHDTAHQTQVHAQISVSLLTGSKAEATVSEIVSLRTRLEASNVVGDVRDR